MVVFPGALLAYEEAKQICESTKMSEIPTRTSLLVFIGNIKGQQYDFPGALTAYEEAQAIFERNNGIESLDGAAIMADIGNIKGQQKDFNGAVQAYSKAKLIYEKIGQQHTPAADQLTGTLNAMIHAARS